MLDVSISEWYPKVSKIVGLTNYTFESQNPGPLGTMFQNGLDCHSGYIVFRYIVQDLDSQASKIYQDSGFNLLNGSLMKAHTAEVLRQVNGPWVVKDG